MYIQSKLDYNQSTDNIVRQLRKHIMLIAISITATYELEVPDETSHDEALDKAHEFVMQQKTDQMLELSFDVDYL